MDVDGTLTDGKIYIGHKGEVLKAFNVKDGTGINKLYKNNILPVIITGRNSEIVNERARELNITEVHQGKENKMIDLLNISEKYNCKLSEVAYIGDDENDLQCIEMCGFTACPNDAVETVKSKVNYVCLNKGGDGAVREFIEVILSKNLN